MTIVRPRRRLLLAAGAFAFLAACAGPTAPPLSAGDQSAVDRVQNWLDGVHGFRARFLQIWPDGAVSEGVARFDPPGRLRLDYLPTPGMTLIAHDGHIVVTDPHTGSTTRMPTTATPLGLLLDPGVQLSGAIRVTDVQRPAGALQVSLARNASPQSGLLTLTFDEPPNGALRLVRLEAVDAEGRHTRFRLSDETTGETFPPAIFTPG